MSSPGNSVGVLEEDFTVTGYDPIPTLPRDRNGDLVMMRPQTVRLCSAVNPYTGGWVVEAARVHGPKITKQGRTTTRNGLLVYRTHIFKTPTDPDPCDEVPVPQWLTPFALARTPITGAEAMELRIARLTAELHAAKGR